MSGLDPRIADRLKRNADGLVCAVAQQRGSGEVLMVAWMDDEALHRTLSTGRATYWSRSRQTYWVKGETSGHTQQVHDVRVQWGFDKPIYVQYAKTMEKIFDGSVISYSQQTNVEQEIIKDLPPTISLAIGALGSSFQKLAVSVWNQSATTSHSNSRSPLRCSPAFGPPPAGFCPMTK